MIYKANILILIKNFFSSDRKIIFGIEVENNYPKLVLDYLVFDNATFHSKQWEYL
jgi:hypothetical protein